MRNVAGVLWTRLTTGQLPDDLPIGSLFRVRESVAEFFGHRYFGMGVPANLFVTKGKGWAITGLTPLGRRAWQVTRNWLIFHGYVKEQND